MAPHLTAFAARVDELWAARRIWPGERCVLSDAAMLAAAKAGDPNLQGQVRCCCIPVRKKCAVRSGGAQISALCRVLQLCRARLLQSPSFTPAGQSHTNTLPLCCSLGKPFTTLVLPVAKTSVMIPGGGVGAGAGACALAVARLAGGARLARRVHGRVHAAGGHGCRLCRGAPVCGNGC